jgi:hypothetical protein
MEPKNRNRGALIVNVPIAKKGVWNNFISHSFL